jgi:hypothetical protein
MNPILLPAAGNCPDPGSAGFFEPGTRKTGTIDIPVD